MSKGVSKFCSISNYLRHEDEELSNVIQDLCIGKAFVPRKGSAGVTFLRPSAATFKKIKALASGENPEEAVDAFYSLILLDHIASIKEFADKQSDIPTALRKKLPVSAVDGKKVTLKNGATITPDPSFKPRGDRTNINVFLYDGDLPDVSSMEAASFANAKPKAAKKGGYELAGVQNRQQLFDMVVDKFVAQDRETNSPAELLVSLYRWAEFNNNTKLCLTIKSLCSGDSLASLAIVLRPYAVNNGVYLSDEDLKTYLSAAGYVASEAKEGPIQSTESFTNDKNFNDTYNNLCSTTIESDYDGLETESNEIERIMSKPKAVDALTAFYNTKASGILKGVRSYSPKVAFAEAELRIMSAVMLDNAGGYPSKDEVMKVFRDMCKLDEPYVCSDKEAINASTISFYYSTVHLMARSDALLYLPGIGYSGSLEAISDGSVKIHLGKYIKIMMVIRSANSSANIMRTRSF